MCWRSKHDLRERFGKSTAVGVGLEALTPPSTYESNRLYLQVAPLVEKYAFRP